MTTKEGAVLGHERFGYGNELVIVLHEFYGNLRTWDPIRSYLDTERFQYAFADLRGYGTSARLKGEHTAAEIASDVNALATHLAFDRYHLVGHSMSGVAVQHALVRDTSTDKPRIQKVVAVTPVPTDGFTTDPDTRSFFESTISDDQAFAEAIAGLTGGRWGEPYLRAKRQANRASSNPRVMRGYLHGLIFPNGFAATAAKAHSATPLLMIAGAHDLAGMRLVDLKRSMGDAFPKAEWHELPGAGHYPMDEAPLALADSINRFLSA